MGPSPKSALRRAARLSPLEEIQVDPSRTLPPSPRDRQPGGWSPQATPGEASPRQLDPELTCNAVALPYSPRRSVQTDGREAVEAPRRLTPAQGGAPGDDGDASSRTCEGGDGSKRCNRTTGPVGQVSPTPVRPKSEHRSTHRRQRALISQGRTSWRCWQQMPG